MAAKSPSPKATTVGPRPTTRLAEVVKNLMLPHVCIELGTPEFAQAVEGQDLRGKKTNVSAVSTSIEISTRI